MHHTAPYPSHSPFPHLRLWWRNRPDRFMDDIVDVTKTCSLLHGIILLYRHVPWENIFHLFFEKLFVVTAVRRIVICELKRFKARQKKVALWANFEDSRRHLSSFKLITQVANPRTDNTTRLWLPLLTLDSYNWTPWWNHFHRGPCINTDVPNLGLKSRSHPTWPPGNSWWAETWITHKSTGQAEAMWDKGLF